MALKIKNLFKIELSEKTGKLPVFVLTIIL